MAETDSIVTHMTSGQGGRRSRSRARPCAESGNRSAECATLSGETQLCLLICHPDGAFHSKAPMYRQVWHSCAEA